MMKTMIWMALVGAAVAADLGLLTMGGCGEPARVVIDDPGGRLGAYLDFQTDSITPEGAGGGEVKVGAGDVCVYAVEGPDGITAVTFMLQLWPGYALWEGMNPKELLAWGVDMTYDGDAIATGDFDPIPGYPFQGLGIWPMGGRVRIGGFDPGSPATVTVDSGTKVFLSTVYFIGDLGEMTVVDPVDQLEETGDCVTEAWAL